MAHIARNISVALLLLLASGCNHNLTSMTQEAELPLFDTPIPKSVTEKTLESYSDKEKVLIAKDFHNIKDLCLRGCTATDKPTYVGTAGGPGACKTTILETYLNTKSNIAYIDPDPRALKLMINTYFQAISAYKASVAPSFQTVLQNAYTQWRGASNYIANTLICEAYGQGFNIAHGTTMTGGGVPNLFKKLKEKGYAIHLLLCYASDATRVHALTSRATYQAFVQNSPEDAIQKGKIFHTLFPIYFKNADNIDLYWTDDVTPEGVDEFKGSSVLAATYSPADGLTICNEDAFSKFVSKYNEDRNNAGPSFDELVTQ